MKQLSLSLIFCFLCSCTWGQTDTGFHLVRILKGDIVEFTVDNLDNVYVLNSRNQVKKYNSNGDSMAVYNDVKKFGRATLIDVSDPLKVMLYYRDFATVVMLDRFLNAVNTIDLRRQKIFQAKAVGQSYDNRIWVYDEVDNKLKKIDEEGKLLQETPDFRLLLSVAPQPIKIYDENRFVYVYDSIYGVYVFDYYGALKHNIQIQHWQNFKVAGKFIFGSRSDTLFRYDIKNFQFEELKMPQPIFGSKSFNFTSSRLYALRKEEKESLIYIYSIN